MNCRPDSKEKGKEKDLSGPVNAEILQDAVEDSVRPDPTAAEKTD